MTERPGAQLARRPLHFFLLADCSGSMAAAARWRRSTPQSARSLPHLAETSTGQPARGGHRTRDRLLNRRTMARGAPTASRGPDWEDLQSGGYTDLGAALDLLCHGSHRTADGGPGSAAGDRPGLGRHADRRFHRRHATVAALPWGARAVRMAVAIGQDAAYDTLIGSSADPAIEPVTASNPEQLMMALRWATVHVGPGGLLPGGCGSTSGPGNRMVGRDRRGHGVVSVDEGDLAPPVWAVTGASQIGSAHGTASPNQDAFKYALSTLSDGSEVTVVAVSDGHGGARYVRSDTGSRTAVEIAVSRLCAVLPLESGDVPAVDVLRREVPAIVSRWRTEVLSHHAAHAFTEAEKAHGGAAIAQGDPAVAYGATLLVAVVGDFGVGLAQIGDGDALIRTNGFAMRPVPGDDRLAAGETTSLCLDSAVHDFRYSGLPADGEADLVLLATDGYANSFADADWWKSLVDDLAWFVSTSGFGVLSEQLPDWLGDSARIGGDDVSAVILARQPLAVEPFRPAVVPVLESPDEAEPDPPRRPAPEALVETREGLPRTLLDPADAVAPISVAAAAVHRDAVPVGSDTPRAEPSRTAVSEVRSGRSIALVLTSVAILVAALLSVGAFLVSNRGSDPSDIGPSDTPGSSNSPSTPSDSPAGSGDSSDETPPVNNPKGDQAPPRGDSPPSNDVPPQPPKEKEKKPPPGGNEPGGNDLNDG